MSQRRLHPLTTAAAAWVIAACVIAAAAVGGFIPNAASRKAPCTDCGAVAGGVTDAVIGSQFGHGDGRALTLTPISRNERFACFAC